MPLCTILAKCPAPQGPTRPQPRSVPNHGHTAASGDPESQGKPALKLENLMKATLEGVKGTEVIVSRVFMPPHTSFPKHWHPGEEFA